MIKLVHFYQLIKPLLNLGKDNLRVSLQKTDFDPPLNRQPPSQRLRVRDICN
jgi:hypothetical protein